MDRRTSNFPATTKLLWSSNSVEAEVFNMLTRRVPAILILLLALCLGAAAYNARIVRLSLANGEVELDRNVGQGIERAIVNTPITSGMRLDSYEGARAEVEFENGGTVRLSGPAGITFRELSMSGDGDKVTNIEVDHGTVYFDIHHKGDDRFIVNVFGQTVTLDKSAHLRIVANEQTATIAVFKGGAWLEGSGERATIKKNETLTLEASEPGRYLLAKNIAPLSEDHWDRSRDAERDQYASNSGYQYSNTAYGAPYSYGISDMLQYGNYFNAPGYGWLWRPSRFDAGWDPFSSGMWSYYPGAGYVFVSQYPWGWTPYRYGRWVFLNGRGWCWSPQGGYSNWNVVPVVRHAPSGWMPLRRPQGDGGPALFVHDRRLPPTPDPQHYVRPRLPGDGSPRNVGGREARDAADHRTRDRGRLPVPIEKTTLPAVTPTTGDPAGAVVRPQQPARREPVPDNSDAWRRDPSKGGHPGRDDQPMPGAVVRPGKNSEREQERRIDRSVPLTPRVESAQPAPQQPARVEPVRPAPRPVPQAEPTRPAPEPSPRSGMSDTSPRMESPKASSPGMQGGERLEGRRDGRRGR